MRFTIASTAAVVLVNTSMGTKIGTSNQSTLNATLRVPSCSQVHDTRNPGLTCLSDVNRDCPSMLSINGIVYDVVPKVTSEGYVQENGLIVCELKPPSAAALLEMNTEKKKKKKKSRRNRAKEAAEDSDVEGKDEAEDEESTAKTTEQADDDEEDLRIKRKEERRRKKREAKEEKRRRKEEREKELEKEEKVSSKDKKTKSNDEKVTSKQEERNKMIEEAKAKQANSAPVWYDLTWVYAFIEGGFTEAAQVVPASSNFAESTGWFDSENSSETTDEDSNEPVTHQKKDLKKSKKEQELDEKKDLKKPKKGQALDEKKHKKQTKEEREHEEKQRKIKEKEMKKLEQEEKDKKIKEERNKMIEEAKAKQANSAPIWYDLTWLYAFIEASPDAVILPLPDNLRDAPICTPGSLSSRGACLATKSACVDPSVTTQEGLIYPTSMVLNADNTPRLFSIPQQSGTAGVCLRSQIPVCPSTSPEVFNLIRKGDGLKTSCLLPCGRSEKSGSLGAYHFLATGDGPTCKDATPMKAVTFFNNKFDFDAAATAAARV